MDAMEYYETILKIKSDSEQTVGDATKKNQYRPIYMSPAEYRRLTIEKSKPLKNENTNFNHR